MKSSPENIFVNADPFNVPYLIAKMSNYLEHTFLNECFFDRLIVGELNEGKRHKKCVDSLVLFADRLE